MSDTKPIEHMTDHEVSLALMNEVQAKGWTAAGLLFRQLARPADPTPPQTREEQIARLHTVYLNTDDFEKSRWAAVRDEAARMFPAASGEVDLERMQAALEEAHEAWLNSAGSFLDFTRNLATAGFTLRPTDSAPASEAPGARDEDVSLHGASAAGESLATTLEALGTTLRAFASYARASADDKTMKEASAKEFLAALRIAEILKGDGG